jgi:hypothetical protein
VIERSGCSGSTIAFLRSSTGGLRQKIPLDQQLADFGVQLLDLGGASGLPIGTFVVEHAGELLDRLLLPEADQVRMHAVPARQLGYRLLTPDRLHSNLRLELR